MLLQLSSAVTAIFITAALFLQDSVVGCGQFLPARADIRQNWDTFRLWRLPVCKPILLLIRKKVNRFIGIYFKNFQIDFSLAFKFGRKPILIGCNFIFTGEHDETYNLFYYGGNGCQHFAYLLLWTMRPVSDRLGLPKRFLSTRKLICGCSGHIWRICYLRLICRRLRHFRPEAKVPHTHQQQVKLY